MQRRLHRRGHPVAVARFVLAPCQGDEVRHRLIGVGIVGRDGLLVQRARLVDSPEHYVGVRGPHDAVLARILPEQRQAILGKRFLVLAARECAVAAQECGRIARIRSTSRDQEHERTHAERCATRSGAGHEATSRIARDRTFAPAARSAK